MHSVKGNVRNLCVTGLFVVIGHDSNAFLPAVLFCRYDLEATCNKARTLHPIEIIELSCVIIQTATAAITASYQSYVRPTEHPQLDPFCIELCGIQQHQVDAAPLLSDVLQQHHTWLQRHGMLDEGVTCVPVTWTEWDFKVHQTHPLLLHSI